MTIDNKDDYIQYRFRRAEETFDEAQILVKAEKWNAVVNRLYYACFYSVMALLLKEGIETQTHDGARSKFGFHFIKTGKLSKSLGKLFTKLFDYRQKGDYGDLFDFDQDLVKPLIPQVELFLNETKNLLNN